MENGQMRTVLVTGGAGFIGSHLIPLLVGNGYKVRVLDTLAPQIHGMLPNIALDWLVSNPSIEFQRGSVGNAGDLRKSLDGVDSIIHLAAETGTGQSMYEIERYCSANVQATALLMDMLSNGAAPTVKRVVLSSSRSVYGEGAYVRKSTVNGPRIIPDSRIASNLKAKIWEPVCEETQEALVAVSTKESDQTSPSSIYAATKLMQEYLVRVACDTAGIEYSILRLQNVYGEGQSLNNPYTGILSIFSTRIRRDLELPIFEDGKESRDFIHVSDVAAAFLAALETTHAINKTINVGSGVATSVEEVARELCRAFGAPENVRVTGQYRLGDVRHNFADTTRLRNLLNLEPRISLPEGLKRFSAWVMLQPLPEDRLSEANKELQKRNMLG